MCFAHHWFSASPSRQALETRARTLGVAIQGSTGQRFQ